MSKRIILARKIFKKEFEGNEDFRMGYQANIAILLYDRYGIIDMEERNRAANDIIDVIFNARNFNKKNIINKKFTRFEIMEI